MPASLINRGAYAVYASARPYIKARDTLLRRRRSTHYFEALGVEPFMP